MTERDGLAIVGMDCLFPEANGVEAFWQNVLARHCSIQMLGERHLPEHLRSKVESRLSAVMPKLDVKSQQFRLPPTITRNFDVRVLQMLEIVRRLFAEHTNLKKESLLSVLCSQKMMPREQASTSLERRLQVMSFFEEMKAMQGLDAETADHIRGQFAELYDQSFPHPGFEGFLAESSSLMTSIIPKTFDFGGGHIAMDATCASVITALQIAWDAIHCGHNDAAVIVAMSPEAVPSRFVHYAQIGIFTRDAVMPFDENASGSALGEGIGVMLVRRLKDAEAAGDKIHGVIRGIGVSSDGAGSGFVAPKQDGQVRAMRAAYAMSDVDPKLIRMVEAHATGAPKGDITELESMREVFGSPEECPDKIVTGSVKGNVGHMLEASGMASIFKVCSALKDGILPPTIYRTLRPELLDGSTRFELLDEPKPWPKGDVRRFAAASSFGFGGVNAHIILEAHPSTAKDLPPTQTTFSLSSKTEAPVTTDLITAPSTGSSIAASDYVMLSNAEVEAGVLEIIANCTGYEVGELQLDHDLDADLGVDSIKHMEVLLSVGEKFKVQAEEGDQITDYPTIGKLVELAQTRQNTSTGEPSGMMAELMAGLQSGDLPPEAAERLSQMGIAAPVAEVKTVDVPATAVVTEASKVIETVTSVVTAVEVPVALVETVSAPANDYIMLSDAEVEAGVLAIIANCTGYEVGELQLDHDLDADLGVDSIKHMEVLLSVGEKFKVQAEEGDQITDYPTIGKLVELAQTRQNTSTGEPSGMMAELMAGLQSGDLPPEAAERLSQMGIAAPVAEVKTVDVPATAVVTEVPKVVEAKVEAPVVVAQVKPVETPVALVETVSAPANDYVMLSDAEVEAGVLEIIANCTGYEVGELQLDHDLDADLGVDSIKHMEVLLSVGEKFKVQAEEGDQITDYPTIGKLVELAQTRQNTSTGEPSGMMAELMAGLQSGDLPPEAAERLSQMGIAAPAAEVKTVDVPATAVVTETPKAVEAPKMLETPVALSVAKTEVVVSAPANDYVMLSDAEVEAGVLEIIANCTGYEVGELQLDHDLDADLGVDSIKHMEVLLSVGEKFKVQAEEGDQITDYPTIGKLVELAQTRQNTSTGEPSGMMAELMAGLQSGDLPPEAAERLSQMGIAAPVAEVKTVDVPATAVVTETPKVIAAKAETPVVVAQVKPVETPVALVETVSAPANDYVMLSDAEVEAGVLEIIANCTGYEVGELQLDHDLDADLGVDSIKHMEVLLSVGEKFKVQAEEGDQITDYPTIGKLVELAQTRQNTSTGEPSGMMAELMAGLQSGDLPPEAAERLSQMRIAAPVAEVKMVDVPATAVVTEVPKAVEAPKMLETPVIPVVETSVPVPQPKAETPQPIAKQEEVLSVSTNESLALVQKAVAALRNYEPHWVHPHLSLVADLGLSETEMASIRQQLGLKASTMKDLTIQAMAQEIGGVPAPKLPMPETSASIEDWVLVVGKATTSTDELAKAIQKALKTSKGASLKVEIPNGTLPFALVVDRQISFETLQARLEQSKGKTSVLQSLWWGEAETKSPGAMAWLFPGSGSLYAGFLEDLASIDPVAEKVVQSAKAEYKKLVNQELHFEPDTDPLRQRPATVTASAAMARTLQSFGLTPDFVAGHSVGELTACYLAGAIDLPELMRLTTAPFKNLSKLPNGAMAAILGPEAITLQLVAKFAGRVVVSNRNSGQQLVVSGREMDIVAFCEEAKVYNLKPVRLEVQTAYHSPLLGEAHKQYREALQTVTFQMPQLPVISGLSGDQLPFSTLDAAQTRAMLDCAFIAPVNHVSQLRRLQEMGAKVYVDMGPTDRLSRLAKETLDPSAVVLSTNRAKRNGRLAFLETLAQLYILGYDIKAEALSVEVPVPVAAMAATATRSVVATVPTTNGKTAAPANGNGNGHSKVTTQAAVAAPPVRPVQVPSQPTSVAAPNGNGKAVTTAKVSKPALDLLNHRPSLLEPIAVVGMGALMPDANNVEEFWQNLIAGHDAIRELPQDIKVRWKLSTFYNPDPRVPDKTYSKIGAFVPNFEFKPIEFKITPKTSIHMDRSQKMALLCTREAFKDSGYNEREFDRKRVRVIIGTSVPEWHDLAAPRLFFDTVAEAFQRSDVFTLLPKETQDKILEQAREDINSGIPACCEDSMPGGLPNIVAGRVAFCFDIQGGNVIVDAACAASLAALDNAVKALRMGEIDMVIVGGSDSAMSAGSYVGFCKTFALSAKGSFPFDSRADGFVMGEGSGIMLLKRLGDAERDEDKIHAVIRGIGSSSDGRGRGITAPSIDGQVLAMERAYADAGVDPKTIGFMEAHGTSTPLGDSTEFASLVRFFGEDKLDRPIYVGSVKSMIGHLKTAAGVAGLMKAVLAVQHGQIPPTLNFESPNPKINLEKSPFKINTQTVAWEKTSALPLRAAVNSFGFGGTNFHVIVEAYDRDFYHSETFENELRQTRCYQDFYANLLLVEGSEQVVDTVAKTNGSSVPESTTKPMAVPTKTNGSAAPVKPVEDLATALRDTARSLAVVGTQVVPGDASLANFMADGSLRGWVGALGPQDLGSESFRSEHGVKYNYVAGAMAAGIGSADIVVDMAKAGMLGFFGSGGVPLERVEKTIVDIKKRLEDHPKAAFGFNLLHNPIEAGVEDRTIDMYLEHGVTKVSASAYLRLMPTVVRYRAKGMTRRPDGSIFAPNSVFAKVSSLDVAGQFMAPPPVGVLKALVSAGKLTSEEAEIAAQLPVASDITAEADSGGHTDRRALPVLLPQMLRLRDEIAERHGYAQKGIALRIGAAGGIGDPISARAAFAFGADYILTGTINQTSPQSGTSDLAREMLTKATMSDVVMAPAADMFEMGVQVQILKRGSFYPQRAKKLYEIYKTFDSLETIATEERLKLERDIFRQPLDEVWANTASYWEKRDPKQLEKALKDGKHQMALTFRAYLGLSSRWAQTGQVDRKSDYQIWCGPSMGSFNSWVAGTWLEPLENRDVAVMGKALMYGAAVLTRAARLAQFGIAVPSLSELSRPAAREFLLGL